MTTATVIPVAKVANRLVELCRKGDFPGAVKELYAKDVVSIEAQACEGMAQEVHGIEAVIEKGVKWAENTEVHSSKVSDPLISANHFAVEFTMDVTCKQTNQRMPLSEIAVYQVNPEGKIIREQFFYHMDKG